MLNKITDSINAFVFSSHVRSKRAVKNIGASFVIKCLNIILNFLIVPITLGLLNQSRYGIWLTLNSIIDWFGFLDIGLGGGLQNRFSEALAKNNRKLAAVYSSTTYAILGIIVFTVILILAAINPFLNWSSILNAPLEMQGELSILAFSVLILFCCRLFLQPITNIIEAHQEFAFIPMFNMIANLISLIGIYLMLKFYNGDTPLFFCGLLLGASPVVVLLIASAWLYLGKYKEFVPSIPKVNFGISKFIMGLGIKFFIIHVAAVIMFTTDNIIITQLFNPEDVVQYNVAYRYMGIATIFFSIIVRSLWSAYTEAYVKKEYTWIKQTINKQLKLYIISVIIIIFMLIFSNTFYLFWLGEEVKVDFLITLNMAIFFIVQIWNLIFTYFLNGIGKISVQLYYCIFGMIINIPLSIFLAKYCNMGPSGVILATTLCQSISGILLPIQYYKIINEKAFGIWNK